jgi:phosphate acetyltransferase
MQNESLSEHPQMLQNDDLFGSLIRACRCRKAVSVAVCWPCNAVSLAGAVDAAGSGLILPVLVGPEHETREIAAREALDIGACSILGVDAEEDAAVRSVELCRSGRAAALMKGSLHTDVLMHPVLKDQGLRTSRRMSHVFIMEAPLYHRRVLFISDAAINIYPSLEDKVGIVQNAIDLAHALGIAEPKVAILSAIETVNPKIISTVDAAALCKMADRGQIMGAILDGPLAFDTAVSAEAALAKNVRSPVAGEADILIAPDLEAANMLAKQLEYLGGARLAGIVMGAKVPIILTSRADSAESRVASCAIASILLHYRAMEQGRRTGAGAP